MRELHLQNYRIFQAKVFDFFGAVVVGGVTSIIAFGLKWAMSGGSTCGIVGAGMISDGVDMIIGANADELSKPVGRYGIVFIRQSVATYSAGTRTVS